MEANIETTGAPASIDEGANERLQNRIPGHKVIEGTKDLPDDQRREILWLHAHYYDSGKSLSDIAELVGYDAGTLSKVFRGKYEGNMTDVTTAITRFRKLAEERADNHKAPFIETRLYSQIEEACQFALTFQRPVFVFGEAQIGKTASLKHYAKEHNHGETTYVSVPVGGSFTNFLRALSIATRGNDVARMEVLQTHIMKCFNSQKLLIVDECHRALGAKSYGGFTLKTFDFIRDIYDQTGCGVVYCGTNVFRDQLADQAMSKFLNQANRRAIARIQLPNIPYRADLNAFARHYGLDPATGEALKLQTIVARECGAGVWLTTLQLGAKRASKRKEKMSWAHVLDANAFIARMAQKPKDEEEA